MKPKTSKQIVIREIEISSDDEPPPVAFSLEGKVVTKRKNGYHKPGTKLSLSGFTVSSGKICFSEKSKEFSNRYFPGVIQEEWSDWKWQIRNSIRDLKKLKEFLFLSADEEILISENSVNLPLRITPYYLSLLDPYDPGQALRKSVVPVISEFRRNSHELPDPLCEHEHLVAPNLVHRYPDRVLFLTTGFCSTYCRYCTRSNMVAKKDKSHFSIKQLEPAFNYIKSHPEVRDVLLSGGDPLTLSDEKLFGILDQIRTIPHVEIIRIGTKVPVVLPQRITLDFAEKLKKYHPLWISIHFTHPDELTEETIEACNRLANSGIPLGSQTVLLNGINDEVSTMKSLMHKLLMARVRPYYLYQCDPVPGSAHFRTPVEKGLEIIKGLRGHTSGYAVPHFVIDAPGGGGKIPLLPEYFAGRDEHGNVLLRNYEDRLFTYPEVD